MTYLSDIDLSEFARKKGSKDKQKRKSRIAKEVGLALGLTGLGAGVGKLRQDSKVKALKKRYEFYTTPAMREQMRDSANVDRGDVGEKTWKSLQRKYGEVPDRNNPEWIDRFNQQKRLRRYSKNVPKKFKALRKEIISSIRNAASGKNIAIGAATGLGAYGLLKGYQAIRSRNNDK